MKALNAVGQDAIPPCPLHYALPNGSIKTYEDMDRIIVSDPRLARIKLNDYIKAVSGTKLGVGVCITSPLTSTYTL